MRGLGDKPREARLRRYGHVRNRQAGCGGRRVLVVGLPKRRQRRRPKRRYLDVTREGVGVMGVVEEDAENRNKLRTLTRRRGP